MLYVHLQELNLLAGSTETQAAITWDKDELVGQLSDLCEALLAEGFRWRDVQSAVQVSCVERSHYRNNRL